MRLRVLALAALLAACDADAASSQGLRERVRAAGDGTVVFRFAAREGVCGDGTVIVRMRGPERQSVSWMRRNSERTHVDRDFDRLETWCIPGPVFVSLRREQSLVTGIELAVGDNPFDDARDLGAVPADEAATFLIEDVTRTGSKNSAERALHAASLADARTWPAMLALARDEDLSRDIRRNARHLLAMDASESVMAGQPAPDDEAELRRQAVFALSRRDDEPSRSVLWELAESGADPPVRSAALFWLGISEEPRALDLLERVLQRGG